LTTKHCNALLGSRVDIRIDKDHKHMSIDPKIKTRFIYEWRPHNTLYYIVRHILTEDLTKQSQIYDNTGFIMHCKFSIVTGPNRRQVSIYIYQYLVQDSNLKYSCL